MTHTNFDLFAGLDVSMDQTSLWRCHVWTPPALQGKTDLNWR
jgi:hypothetical protein